MRAYNSKSASGEQGWVLSTLGAREVTRLSQELEKGAAVARVRRCTRSAETQWPEYCSPQPDRKR